MNKAIIILFLLVTNLLVGQTTAIPDPNFEQELINLGYDNILDGVVLTSNISNITSINLNSKGINSLVGIQDFAALQTLYCWGNNLGTINVTNNPLLEELNAHSNNISWINLTQNPLLRFLQLTSNLLTSIDVSQNPNLESLLLHDNQLSYLDVSSNSSLLHLQVGFNSITSLNVSQNVLLEELSFQANQVTSIDLTKNYTLDQLTCDRNNMTSLNLTYNTIITEIICSENPLTCLNIKNGSNSLISTFRANFTPDLFCIEVDDTAYSLSQWTNTLYFRFDPNILSESCVNPCAVSLEELNISTLTIHPNPTSTHFTIEGIDKPYNLSIYNSLGQLLLTESNVLESSKRVNVSKYSKGLLFIRIESDGEVYHHKIVKSN